MGIVEVSKAWSDWSWTVAILFAVIFLIAGCYGIYWTWQHRDERSSDSQPTTASDDTGSA